MRSARSCRFALAPALTALCLSTPAFAFKEPGHRAIEAAAYAKLLESSACDHCEGFSERDVIQTLIRYGVIRPPARPVAVDPNGDQREYTEEGLVVASHLPDHFFDRQLQADRQCFHFNARGAHMTRYSELPEEEPASRRGPGRRLSYLRWGVPRALVEDAYIECLGTADALLRSILSDPKRSNGSNIGLYALMHMIEDSFADSHVARDQEYRILYVKPWTVRTWVRYFLGNTRARPIRSHFSEQHHTMSDTRDLGYLLERTDPRYEGCLKDATARSGKAKLEPEDLEGDMVVPPSCLSDRARKARDAIVDLLRMVARLLPTVSSSGERQLRQSTELERAWADYRRAHLAHRDIALTDRMSTSRWGYSAAETRNGYVYTADDLVPGSFADVSAGLTTELRTGTPLWIGIDTLVARNTAQHHKTVLPLDTLGWGVQLRLPLENEFGERPVGVAVDLGAGLPLPISDLVNLTEVQIHLGFRLRGVYGAQSVFESETRHTLEFGFGGISVDVIIDRHVWVGLDAPRKLYRYDFWENSAAWQDAFWAFSAGVATDAY